MKTDGEQLENGWCQLNSTGYERLIACNKKMYSLEQMKKKTVF